MPQLSEIELKKQISSGDFARLYFLYGSEKYLIRHYTALIRKKAIDPSFADFNFHQYDGKEVDFDEVAQAAEALPNGLKYAAGGRCVITDTFTGEEKIWRVGL